MKYSRKEDGFTNIFSNNSKILKTMIQALYGCSQQELYTVCQLALISCNQHIIEFGNFKAKYNPAYITARQNEIIAAEELPDAQARGAQSEVLRVLLIEKNKEALDIWQGLKRYNADAFPKNQQKAKLEEAGQNYYEDASKNDWDATKGLLSSGNLFITNNLAELVANDNMPPAFATQFSTLKTQFTTLHLDFLNKRETSETGTQEKIIANNIIYDKLMSMLLDGQYIFRNDPATKKQFVFADLIYKASGAGTAGIKGTVTDAVSQLPLKDVEIRLLLTVKKGKTDEEGKYEITRVAHGEFNIEARLAGYETKIISKFEILVGTVSTVNIELTPIVPEP